MNKNLALAKKLNYIAVAITVVILLLVGMMRRFKLDIGLDLSFMPSVIAVINTIVAILLIMALIAIKKKNVNAHTRYIYGAMFFSALFLINYVAYHFTTTETTYCGEGFIRKVYYFVLISHIILAGISLPFILFTFIKGYTGQIDAHRKMAKYVWPAWLYVSVSGPIVFLMLRPCYG